MTEENKKPLKKFSTKKKLILVLIAVAACFFVFQFLQITKNKSKNSNEKNDIVGDIFDLSESYKGDDNYDLSELTVSEMKERGAEFIYQSILKNQVQINDLKQQIQDLHSEFAKYKSQEKIGKVIFAYIDFRGNLYSSKPYSENFKNLETLAFFDQNLQGKITKLKPLLNNFSNKNKLQNDFKKIIPDLIATKHSAGENGIVAKITRYISKLIVIRRIDEKNSPEVDVVITKIEKSLADENYQESMNQALLLSKEYHEVLVNFLEELNNAIEIQKIDNDILDYLKKLTS